MGVSRPDVLIRKGVYTWMPPLPQSSIVLSRMERPVASTANQPARLDLLGLHRLVEGQHRGITAVGGLQQGAAWNTGRIFATALVVYVAGKLEERGTVPKTAWMIALGFARFLA